MQAVEFIAYFAMICQKIAELADDIGETHWAKCFFRPAYLVLTDNALSIDEKLIKAIRYTQVFGGMGSWLDSPPFSAEIHQKTTEYDQLTDALYDCRKYALKLI